jgi:hypothetical protein
MIAWSHLQSSKPYYCIEHVDQGEFPITVQYWMMVLPCAYIGRTTLDDRRKRSKAPESGVKPEHEHRNSTLSLYPPCFELACGGCDQAVMINICFGLFQAQSTRHGSPEQQIAHRTGYQLLCVPSRGLMPV